MLLTVVGWPNESVGVIKYNVFLMRKRTRARRQDFILGGHRSCEGALFLKKVDDLFSRRPQNLSSQFFS